MAERIKTARTERRARTNETSEKGSCYENPKVVLRSPFSVLRSPFSVLRSPLSANSRNILLFALVAAFAFTFVACEPDPQWKQLGKVGNITIEGLEGTDIKNIVTVLKGAESFGNLSVLENKFSTIKVQSGSNRLDGTTLYLRPGLTEGQVDAILTDIYDGKPISITKAHDNGEPLTSCSALS
jgi:hypothetical protein